MEDFFKPKICWNRIAAIKQFALVKGGIFIQDSMHFIVGDNLNYLCSVLNSKLFQWLLFLIVGEAAGGNAGNAENIWNLHIPQNESDDMLTDSDIYTIFKLTHDEQSYVEHAKQLISGES